MTYTAGTDTTTFNNNLLVSSGKKLYIGTMDVEAEINALDTSITTGNINTTDLTTNNLIVNNNARFGETGGTTFIKNDMRFCNVVNKSENEFSQFYQTGNEMVIINHRPLGEINFQIKNNDNTAIDTICSIFNGGVTLYGDVNIENGNAIFNENMTCNGVTDFNDTANAREDLYIYKNIVLFTKGLTIENTKILSSNLNLSFPLDEYNIIRQNGINISIVLPSIATANNGVVTSVIMIATTSTCTISVPLGTTLYDMNRNSIANIVLTASTILNVRFISNNNNWYIVDFSRNPNSVVTNTVTTTSLNSTTITNSGSITTNTLTTNSNATIKGNATIEGTTTLEQDTIIEGDTFARGRFKNINLTPGYMFDGGTSFNITPVVCSIKGFRPADNDDYWYINPGFRFDIYPNDNYGGSAYTLANDNDYPVVFPANSTNQVGSIKVFYRNAPGTSYTEITMEYIS
jgi:hypothetical protein